MGSAHGSTNNHYAKEDRIYHLIMARRAMAAVILLLSLHSLAAAQGEPHVWSIEWWAGAARHRRLALWLARYLVVVQSGSNWCGLWPTTVSCIESEKINNYCTGILLFLLHNFYYDIIMVFYMDLWYCFTPSWNTAPISPQFLSQPTDMIAALSSTVTLDCSASGNPTITWYKDRQPLSLDSRRQRQSDGSLRITNLQNSDGGQYYCLASDSAAGSVASLTATLQIACKSVSEII